MGQTPSGPRLEEGATSPDAGTRGQGLPPAPRPQGPGALAPTALVPYPSAARLPQRRGLGRFAPPSEPAAAAPARVRAPCVPLLLRSAPHPLGPWSARGAPTAAGFPRGPSRPRQFRVPRGFHRHVSLGICLSGQRGSGDPDAPRAKAALRVSERRPHTPRRLRQRGPDTGHVAVTPHLGRGVRHVSPLKRLLCHPRCLPGALSTAQSAAGIRLLGEGGGGSTSAPGARAEAAHPSTPSCGSAR